MSTTESTPPATEQPPERARGLGRVAVWLRGGEVNIGDSIFRGVTAIFAVGAVALLLLIGQSM